MSSLSEKEMLVLADALAEFSNLEPSGVEGFRARHPNFTPDWWNFPAPEGGKEETPTQWQFSQKWLREAWAEKEKFSDIFNLIRILTSAFDPTPIPFLEPEGPSPGFISLIGFSEFPYHQAVVYLASPRERWRAKFCSACGKRFVAGASKQKYCGDICAQERHKQAKLRSYHRHPEWRPKKKSKKPRKIGRKRK